MNRAIVIAALLTMSAPANASIAEHQLDGVMIQVPPLRFQGNGTFLLRTTDLALAVCDGTLSSEAVGCAAGSVVIMPNPCDFPRQSYAALLCHEKAHAVSGWRHESK
jgi:hypothetical protein